MRSRVLCTGGHHLLVFLGCDQRQLLGAVRIRNTQNPTSMRQLEAPAIRIQFHVEAL